MSRSFSKNYLAYVGYKSNKPGKKEANKAHRRAEKEYLRGADEIIEVKEEDYDFDDPIDFKISQVEEKRAPKMLREVSDVYNFPSDGLPVYIGKGVKRK